MELKHVRRTKDQRDTTQNLSINMTILSRSVRACVIVYAFDPLRHIDCPGSHSLTFYIGMKSRVIGAINLGQRSRVCVCVRN